MAEILLAGLAASAALSLLRKALAPLRIGLKAVRTAFHVLTRGRPWTSEKITNEYSAWFLLNSAKRVQSGLSQGRSLKDLLAQEMRYAQQHAKAQEQRKQAAQEARAAADVSVAMVGEESFKWTYMHTEADCTPINGVYCEDLDGRVFPYARPPKGRYPGMWHPNCRCKAMPVMTSVNSRPYTDNDLGRASR